MARLAVLASGDGSNFQALVEAIRAGGKHEAVLLACDRPGAFVLERAKRLGVPALVVRYPGRPREDAEAELAQALADSRAELVALAGFMRILGGNFVRLYSGRLVNVHPSMLPAYPGVHSIERAWQAGERELGVTVHFVDEGMDTGTIIEQVAVSRRATLGETEAAIHDTEHDLYPRVVASLLDGFEA